MIQEGQTGFVRFPPVTRATDEGIVAVGGDLEKDTLLSAYCQGIFPWYSDGQPILWWSPDPRFVLFPDRLHFPGRLARSVRQKGFVFSCDTRFAEVIRHCAEVPRKEGGGTWLTREMIRAYTDFHEAGWAHSIEVSLDGELCGGLYGVQIGAAFFGESMFHTVPDASKAALAVLAGMARKNGWHFIDSQVQTEHLLKFGACLISRREYLKRLAQALEKPSKPGRWGEFNLFDLFSLAFYNDQGR